MNARFAAGLLRLIAGPLIWLAHFLFVYTVNALACGRPSAALDWAGFAVSSWIIVAGGAMALGGMVLIVRRQRRRARTSGARAFDAWLAQALCVLSAVAVVWETLPVFLMPPCARHGMYLAF